MTLIRIRQRSPDDIRQAVLSFDGGEEFPIVVEDPFSEEDEENLEWYFQEYLRFPFTDQVRYRQAADSLVRYGENLFGQIFQDPDAYARYRQTLSEGFDELRLEIAGAPEFHGLHWEALKDPKIVQPLALRVPLVRRNIRPQTLGADVRTSPTLNILLVVARPRGGKDVGYRTISRPLVEGLRNSAIRARVDILRPGPTRLWCGIWRTRARKKGPATTTSSTSTSTGR